MEPAAFDLNLYRGDAKTVELTFTDDENDPIDLSGASFASQARKTADATATNEIVDFTATVVSATNGRVDLAVSSANSEAVEDGWVWDLERQDVKETFLYGVVRVQKDVTRG